MFIEKVGKALANVPKPYLERPNRDVTVLMSVETVGRGKHIYIPVEVNGITKTIFSTQAVLSAISFQRNMRKKQV